MISAFPPNFRVCFLCDLQQNCPIPVTPVLAPSSDSIQNRPGAQLTFLSKECTWHRTYASSAFISLKASPSMAGHSHPVDREGSQPAQTLLGLFNTFWLNQNQLSMFMHHFYPALEALQPCWPETLCLTLLLVVHGHCASGTSGGWDRCDFTPCFLEYHRPRNRNTVIKDHTQQEFQWVWDSRAQQRLLSQGECTLWWFTRRCSAGLIQQTAEPCPMQNKSDSYWAGRNTLQTPKPWPCQEHPIRLVCALR